MVSKEVLKLKLPSEKQTEAAVIDFLNTQPHCFAFKVITSGTWDEKSKSYRRPSRHVMPGTPDVLVCLQCFGIPIFIGMEIKSHKGNQSDSQKLFESILKTRSGGYYFVIKTLADAEQAIFKVKRDLFQALNLVN